MCPQKGRKYEEQALAVPISDGVFLPVLASRPPGASIDLAVVAMHGKPRDYEEYFRKTPVARLWVGFRRPRGVGAAWQSGGVDGHLER